jgi:hypothetical protein
MHTTQDLMETDEEYSFGTPPPKSDRRLPTSKSRGSASKGRGKKKGSAASVSSVGSNSTGGSRGLPPFVKKQLAEDFETKGGIHLIGRESTYKLAEIIADNPDVYSSQDVRKLENQLSYWKGLSESKYEAVIVKLGVKPFRVRVNQEPLSSPKLKKPKASRKVKTSKTEVSFELSDDDSSSSKNGSSASSEPRAKSFRSKAVSPSALNNLSSSKRSSKASLVGKTIVTSSPETETMQASRSRRVATGGTTDAHTGRFFLEHCCLFDFAFSHPMFPFYCSANYG